MQNPGMLSSGQLVEQQPHLLETFTAKFRSFCCCIERVQMGLATELGTAAKRPEHPDTGIKNSQLRPTLAGNRCTIANIAIAGCSSGLIRWREFHRISPPTALSRSSAESNQIGDLSFVDLLTPHWS